MSNKNPTPGDLKQMDTDELCGKKTSYEQLVSYFFETHGYLPVKNTKKKDLAKEIIDAKTSGHNFYLHLSIDGIKVELAKYGRRYYNLTVQRKTLVDHLRAIEVKNANVSNDLSPSSMRPAHTRLIFFPSSMWCIRILFHARRNRTKTNPMSMKKMTMKKMMMNATMGWWSVVKKVSAMTKMVCWSSQVKKVRVNEILVNILFFK